MIHTYLCAESAPWSTMRLAFLASVLLAHGRALLSFQPGAFMIRRQCGQLGFATETEWQYGGKSPNPLDPTTPKRTVEASGISVRVRWPMNARLSDPRNPPTCDLAESRSAL